jgi:DNA-3-methyladenine glycosylase
LLLGGVLTCRSTEGTVRLRLTELEAYSGEGGDPGSHAHRGRTARNAVMFGPSGRLYTYFTYGMHVCANVVTGPDGTAGGILFRAGEVIEGVDLARRRRTTSTTDADLARGPARLCVALGIELADYGLDLFAPESRVTLALPAVPAEEDRIGTGPRTGIAGEGAPIPWRFWLKDDATVSPYRAHAARRRTDPGRS